MRRLFLGFSLVFFLTNLAYAHPTCEDLLKLQDSRHSFFKREKYAAPPPADTTALQRQQLESVFNMTNDEGLSFGDWKQSLRDFRFYNYLVGEKNYNVVEIDRADNGYAYLFEGTAYSQILIADGDLTAQGEYCGIVIYY